MEADTTFRPLSTRTYGTRQNCSSTAFQKSRFYLSFLCCKHDHQVGRGPQLGPAWKDSTKSKGCSTARPDAAHARVNSLHGLSKNIIVLFEGYCFFFKAVAVCKPARKPQVK